MKLGEFKSYLYNATEELKRVSSILQKSNSVIEDSNKLLSITRYPFIQNVSLSGEVKEAIRKKFSERARETRSTLLSLVSVVDVIDSGKHHHVLSAEIYNEEVREVYINYDFLSQYLKLSGMFLSELSKTSSIERIVGMLTDELRNKTTSTPFNYNALGARSEGLELAIERLKAMISAVYGTQYKVDSEYFLFSVDNVRFKFASDYMGADNNFQTGSRLAYNFYQTVMNRDLQAIQKQSALVKYVPNKSFSTSQTNAFLTMNKAINIVIGAGGSGKTFMAKTLCENALELNAVLRSQNFEDCAPILYTTFSKGSLTQFLKYCQNGNTLNSKLSILPLVFTRTKEVIREKLAVLSESCDTNRYHKIDAILKNINVSVLANTLETQARVNEETSEYLDYVFASKDLQYVDSYVEFLKSKNVSRSFFTELMIAWGFKEQERYKVPSDIMQGLFTCGRPFPAQVLESQIDDVVNAVTNKYLKNSALFEEKFEDNFFKRTYDLQNVSVYNGLNYGKESQITFEDVIYYLKHYPVMQNNAKQDIYRELLTQMLDAVENNKAIDFYKKVELKNGKTSRQPDIVKMRAFCDLFPISADLVTNITDLDVYFERIIADEAVLIPGIFTSVLLAKANAITALGDINQLELNLNLQGDVQHQVAAIHASDPKPYPLSYSEAGNQVSLFYHLKRMINENDSLKVLVDNFRCRKEIFELSQIIQDKYTEYIQRYKAINNITGNDFIKFYNDSTDIYRFGDTEEIRSPFLFISESPQKYAIVEELLEENDVAIENVFIVVPFKEQINIVKSMLKNKEITVDVLENLQGRDAEVVIYDSFIERNISDEYRELTIQKFNLTVTRAKNLFIFIGDFQTCWKLNLSDRSDEATEIIRKFFREKTVPVSLLSIDENADKI